MRARDICVFFLLKLSKIEKNKNLFNERKKYVKLWWKPKYWVKKHHKVAYKRKMPKSLGMQKKRKTPKSLGMQKRKKKNIEKK